MGDDHIYTNEDVKLLMMNSQSSTGIEIGDMPEWLLVEVLIRLPAKFVFRFKLVSKQWLSTISDPIFVRAYVSRALLLSPKQPWTSIRHDLTHPKASKSRLLHPDDQHLLLNEVYSQQYYQVAKSSYSELPLPNCFQKQIFKSKDEEYHGIFCTSSGLVLCGSLLPYFNLYICNPVTGQSIFLPQFTRCHDDNLCTDLGFTAHVENGSLESYRVVILEIRIKNNTFKPTYVRGLHFKVFFSEIGEWKSFNVSTYIRGLNGIRGSAIAINGVLYWTIIIKQNDIDSIIVYDPYRSPQQVHLIVCPEKLNDPNLLSEYKGKLRYIRLYCKFPQSPGPFFKVWLLNDDHHLGGGGGDWLLQHNITNTDILFDVNLSFKYPYIRVSFFHPFDSDVVYLRCGDDMFSFNFETKKLEIQQKFGKRVYYPFDILLAIPPWPISINPSPSFGAGSSTQQDKLKCVRKQPVWLKCFI